MTDAVALERIWAFHAGPMVGLHVGKSPGVGVNVAEYVRADLHAAALAREAALREALDKARDPGREPDYCYDEEWEYTMAWAEWPDLMDGHDLTEPTEIYSLYKGPRKWVVRVPTDGDDSEVRIFDSEEAARAALGAKP